MVTLGSISREKACEEFPFLASRYRGRRKALKEFTHRDPDFVFWIYPDGRLFDAKDAHIKNVPKGYEYIVKDEPNYGGFLRGRVASNFGDQLITVYCPEEALVYDVNKMSQFLSGISQLPIPISNKALVVSDNGDIYGTIKDIEKRIREKQK